jgi:hypothetical protein
LTHPNTDRKRYQDGSEFNVKVGQFYLTIYTNGASTTDTLVKAIANAYKGAADPKPDKLTLTLVKDNAKVDMTYTVSVAK